MQNNAESIVWFFGPSGAGKRTTIEQLVEEMREPYMSNLGVHTSQKVSKCQESLDTSSSRPDLSEIILSKYDFGSGDFLLVKGQTSDLDRSVPGRLRGRLINVKHKVVFLWATPEELNRRRLQNERLSGWGINNHIHEIKVQVEKVDKLREEGFPVVWIDNTGKHPKALTHSEVILRTEELNETS